MQTFWIIVAALGFNAAALAIMFFYFRRVVRRTLALDEVLDRAREEIGALIAEMNQSADRNVSLLEDRIAKATAAAEAIEKRLGALGRQASDRAREKEIFDRLSRAGTLVSPERRTRAGEGARPEAARSGAAEEVAEEFAEAETAAEEPRVANPPRSGGGEAAEPEDLPPARGMPRIERRPEQIESGPGLRERVVALWERGFSSQAIAPKLGMTVAETDLIIAMEEQRRLLGN
jgi:hypothetical protein